MDDEIPNIVERLITDIHKDNNTFNVQYLKWCDGE